MFKFMKNSQTVSFVNYPNFPKFPNFPNVFYEEGKLTERCPERRTQEKGKRKPMECVHKKITSEGLENN